MKHRWPFHCPTVWPPTILVALFFVVYGLLTSGLWFLQLRFVTVAGDLSGLPEIKQLHQVILGGAAFIYAVYRLARFHPACHWTYAAWLKLSPWTPNQPLPLGPVHPVWQDAAVIGVLTAIAEWHAHVDPALPAVAFGLSYLIVMTGLLAMTRQWPAFLMLGFLWPALMLPDVEGWPGVVLLVAIVLVIWLGHRRSLRAFPWPFLDQPNRLKAPGGKSDLKIEIRVAGRDW